MARSAADRQEWEDLPEKLHSTTISLREAAAMEELAREAHYRPGKLAVRLGLSEWQLRRAFHDAFGCSPREWLLQLRLKHAEASLCEDGLAKNASASVGFMAPHNFSRWFKAQKQVTASQFLAGLQVESSTSAQVGSCNRLPA